MEVTKNRTNNIALTIAIYDTSVNVDKIEGTSPMLILDEDLSF